MSAPAATFLLEYFDRLAEAPSGVAKLRKLILRLAVEGKLVEATAQKLVLVPLGELCESQGGNGKMIKGKLSDLPGAGLFPCFSASGQDVWHDQYEHEGEAIIISAVGARCGKTFVATGKWSAIANTHILFPKSGCSLAYLHLITNNEDLWIRGGSAQPFVKVASTRRERLVYFPSLAEQHQIVAKVEGLMGLCNALDAAQREREAVRTRLRTSALHNLTAPKANSKSASLVLQNLPCFTTAPEDVAVLRQSIFQLAISGELCARVGLWKTAQLDSVAECRLGKMLDAHKNTGRPTKYLRNTNVHWFRFELDSIKELKLEADEFAEYEVLPGDVMICEGGHGIGRTAVWRGEIQGIIFQKALHRVRPKKDLHPDFFGYVMKVFYDTGVLSEFYTGAGIPHLTGQELKKIKIPLPPLAEQRRIVAKVSELMTVIDELEATLIAARATAEALLSATIADLN